jgi:hypothetical protein
MRARKTSINALGKGAGVRKSVRKEHPRKRVGGRLRCVAQGLNVQWVASAHQTRTGSRSGRGGGGGGGQDVL